MDPDDIYYVGDTTPMIIPLRQSDEDWFSSFSGFAFAVTLVHVLTPYRNEIGDGMITPVDSGDSSDGTSYISVDLSSALPSLLGGEYEVVVTVDDSTTISKASAGMIRIER